MGPDWYNLRWRSLVAQSRQNYEKGLNMCRRPQLTGWTRGTAVGSAHRAGTSGRQAFGSNVWLYEGGSIFDFFANFDMLTVPVLMDSQRSKKTIFKENNIGPKRHTREPLISYFEQITVVYKVKKIKPQKFSEFHKFIHKVLSERKLI